VIQQKGFYLKLPIRQNAKKQMRGEESEMQTDGVEYLKNEF
jgi:hypothetical protein